MPLYRLFLVPCGIYDVIAIPFAKGYAGNQKNVFFEDLSFVAIRYFADRALRHNGSIIPDERNKEDDNKWDA